MIKGVCKDCPDRRVTRDYNCHSHCERYAEEKRQRAEAKAKEDDERHVSIDEIGRYLAIKDVKTKVRKGRY